MPFNPKEFLIEEHLSWQKSRAPIGVRVDGPGFRIQAGLLLPAKTRSVRGRFDDTDIVHVLRDGFGLRLPLSERSRFVPGGSVASLLLLPDVEQNDVYKSGSKVRGWQLSVVNVRAAQTTANGHEVWNQPLRIIAVLIAL